jgi:hypothetical protein
MSNPQPGIIIPADITNPGHFFACCGILELADCLWPGVLGWFDQSTFRIAPALPQRTLSAILRSFSEAPIEELDPDDARASRMRVNIGQRSLLLDWWRKDDPTGGGDLKTWAGQQCGPQIFRALKGSLSKSLESTLARDPLNHAELIFDTGTAGSRGKGKTISAFYFDARRAGTSLVRAPKARMGRIPLFIRRGPNRSMLLLRRWPLAELPGWVRLEVIGSRGPHAGANT